MHLLRILDYYLVKKISVTVALTLIGLVMFSLIIRITEEVSHVGKGAYTITDALVYSSLLGIPDINTFFPMAGLLGAMIALGILAGNSELIIIQAVGVSKFRIFIGLLWFIIPFSILNLAIQQWVSPKVTAYAYSMKNSKLNNGNFYTSNQTLWSKASGEFIYAQVTKDSKLGNILVLQYTENNYELKQVMIGQSATWLEDQQTWLMHRVQVYSFNENNREFDATQQEEIKKHLYSANLNADKVLPLLEKQLLIEQNFNVQLYADYKWQTTLTPDKLSLVNSDTNNFSLTSLWVYIKYLNETQQNANYYTYLFWSKLFAGLSFMVMMFVATSSVFGNMRNVSIMMKIFFAVILGLIFFVLNNTVGPFIMNYGIPPILAALLPSIIFMLYGVYLFTKK